MIFLKPFLNLFTLIYTNYLKIETKDLPKNKKMKVEFDNSLVKFDNSFEILDIWRSLVVVFKKLILK